MSSVTDRAIDLDVLLHALTEAHACTEDDDEADVLTKAIVSVRRAQSKARSENDV